MERAAAFLSVLDGDRGGLGLAPATAACPRGHRGRSHHTPRRAAAAGRRCSRWSWQRRGLGGHRTPRPAAAPVLRDRGPRRRDRQHGARAGSGRLDRERRGRQACSGSARRRHAAQFRHGTVATDARTARLAGMHARRRDHRKPSTASGTGTRGCGALQRDTDGGRITPDAAVEMGSDLVCRSDARP